MLRRLGALSCGIACALLASHAAAQLPGSGVAKRGFELTADAVEYEEQREIYVARGSVRIVSGDTELTADWMAYSEKRSRGVATGNVVYRADGDELLAEFVEFNFDTERGILFAGRFRSGENQFRMEGDEIVKHGDDTYSFEQGMFTTCRCPPGETDPWQIQADSADLEVGGYGTARNTTFEILGVPILWLPWMIYPLKTERESGLLFPEFGYSGRNGFEIGLPIFWAARDNVNVTATPHWLSKRGPKADLEVEYVFGERSRGDIAGSFVHDGEIDPHSNEEPYGKERWSTHGRKDFFLPGGLRLKSDFQFVSDNDYLIDFDDIPASKNDRFLESKAFVGRSFGGSGRFGAVAGAVYADDLQNPDDQDRDSVLLQRLPTGGLAALPAPVAESIPVLDHIVPSFDADYAYFMSFREAEDKYDGLAMDYYVGDQFIDSGIDGLPSSKERGFPAPLDPHGDDFATAGGPELNGRFEEGELLTDEGHRISVFPRLAVPFRVGNAVEAYPEVGWHQTFYQSDELGSEQRHLLTARVDLRSRLVRRYEGGTTHFIEPRVGYALVTDLGQDQWDNPLFTPPTAVPQRRVRQLDLANVTLDGADRVSEFNGVTLGVSNRIYRPDDAGNPQLLADLYVSNQFRIDDGDFGILFVGGRAFPFEGAHFWANVGFDPEEQDLYEAIFQAAYRARAGHGARLSYRYLRDVPRFFEDFRNASRRYDDFRDSFNEINQVSFDGRLAITRNWAVHSFVAYSFEDSLLIRSGGGVEYTSKCRCWAGGVELSYDRSGGFRFNLVYRLLGMGKQLSDLGPDRLDLGQLAAPSLLDGF